MADAVEPRGDLPTLGTLSYDGVPFGHTQTTGIRISPTQNEAGTGVKFTRYVFSFETHLAGGPTGEPVTSLRQLLSRQGKAFVYTGRGLGEFKVNSTGGGPRDVEYGPKVREVGFRQLGGGNGCVLSWSLETSIPECSDAKSEFAIMELETQISYDVDYAGFATRSVQGHIVIPNRVVGKHINDNIDDYRELVIPPPLPGFARTFAPTVIHSARNRLDFGYSDVELLEVPPEFVTDFDFDESVSSTTAGLAFWSANITAQYEFARNTPENFVPWKHFFELCGHRSRAIAKSIGKKNAGSILPVHFSMRRPRGAKRRQMTFSLSFTFAGSLGQVLGSGFTWQPVPGEGGAKPLQQWAKWTKSLAQSAHHPRGYAKLRFDIGSDPHVSLCDPGFQRVPSILTEMRGSPFGAGGGIGPNDADIKKAIDLIGTKPTKETSWLYYECDVHVEFDSGTVLTRTLPTQRLTAVDSVLGAASGLAGQAVDVASNAGKGFLNAFVPFPVRVAGNAIGGAFGSPPPPPQPGNGGRLDNDSTPPGDNGTQRRTKGACYVYLRGRAARAGFQVPIPALKEAAGQVPVESCRTDRGEGFTQVERFGAGSTVVYIAKWNIRYFLPRAPEPGEVVRVPPNPMLLPNPT